MKGFLVGALSLIATMVAAPADDPRPSQVCRLTLTGLVEGRYDAELVLYHRDGVFHHGYALCPARDNLVHRLALKPSPPIRWETAEGKPLDVPQAMRGYYSYKHPEFAAYKARFAKGEIRVAYPHPTPPLAWDGARLTGMLDVLFIEPDTPTGEGRDVASLVYRISLTADGAPGATGGGYTAWTYAEKDDTYGADNPRRQGAVQVRWDPDFWAPRPGADFAPGRDWPQVGGPLTAGGGADGQAELISNLHDARPLWVSEEIIGGGRGAMMSRGDFSMYPYAWTSLGYGGYAGPSVRDGRVYLHVMEPDAAQIAAHPAVAGNVYVQLGADPRMLANDLKLLRDAVICADARTGRTLWHFRSERTFGNIPESKAGRGTTVCALADRLIARGAGGLYALDARTGALLWQKSGENGVDYSSNASGGFAGTWSHDKSPVLIGGVVVLAHSGTLVGLDPADGRQLWKQENAIGGHAVPTAVTLDGREWVVAQSQLFVPSKKDLERGKKASPERLVLLDPRTGAPRWESAALASNPLTLCVWGNRVCANGVRNLAGDDKASDKFRMAGVEVGLDGARRIWDAPEAGYPPFRATPLAHHGYAYVDARGPTGFQCLDMATGAVVGRHPHIYALTSGDHNWTWHIAANNRIVTSGLMLFTDAAGGFRRLPGFLSLDTASGYMCPVRPAIADGRLFLRLTDRLVCYDLRRPVGLKTEIVDLTCADAFVGAAPGGKPDVNVRFRIVNGALTEVTAQRPRLLGPEARLLNNWLYDDGRAQHRAAIPHGITLDDSGLRGETKVRIGWQYETWSFRLIKGAQGLEGRFTRKALPLATPTAVNGAVGGDLKSAQPELDGANLWNLYLPNSAREGKANLTVALVEHEGRILRAWACSGQVGQSPAEVDATGLTLRDGALNGTVAVIFHDDMFYDLDGAPAAAESRAVGRGGAVAARYTINAQAGVDNQLTGSFDGAYGVAWERSGSVTGRRGPETPL